MTLDTPKRRGHARERILDVAEASILDKGFGATSIDELIAAAGITKSGFFYHFRDKTELARVLLMRYIEREDGCLTNCFVVPMICTKTRCTVFWSGLSCWLSLWRICRAGTLAASPPPIATKSAYLISRSGISTQLQFWTGVKDSARGSTL